MSGQSTGKRQARVALIGSAGVPTVGYYLRELLALGFEVTVLLNEKRESERNLEIWHQRTGGQLQPLDIEPAPIRTFKRISSSECAKALSQFDIGVNGGVLEILKPQAFDAPRLGVVNAHPGILPKYRGCTAVEWSLYNGDPVGVTAHVIDEGIDTGPILAAQTISVNSCESYQDVRLAVYRLSFELAASAVSDFLSGRVQPVKQGEGTYWKPIDEERMAKVISMCGSVPATRSGVSQ